MTDQPLTSHRQASQSLSREDENARVS
jgi:hypothetical protein